MLAIIFLVCLLLSSSLAGENSWRGRPSASWKSWGHADNNWNAQPDEDLIGRNNVQNIVQLWNFSIPYGGMSSRPTTDGCRYIYQTDWNGTLWALDRYDGQVKWQFNVTKYILSVLPNAYAFLLYTSRTSPVISDDGDTIFIGTLSGALIIALDASCGEVLWSTRPEKHPCAVITGSLTYYKGNLYGGVSNSESACAANIPGYQCCTFRGSVFSLRASDGTLRWQTYTIPNITGLYSVSVYGSQPAIDTARNEVKIGVSNYGTVPAFVQTCMTQSYAAINANAPFVTDCRAPGDFNEAVVHLDLDTGYIKTAARLDTIDIYNGPCRIPTTGSQQYFNRDTVLCPPRLFSNPTPAGQDFDFGQSPMFIPGSKHTPFGYDTEVICQKTGLCYALSAQTGFTGDSLNPFWTIRGGIGGAGMFSSATNGKVLFSAVPATSPYNYTLLNGTVTYNAVWAATNILTGKILWTTPIPYPSVNPEMGVTYANGVVYSGTLLKAATNGGYFYALDASTGQILVSLKLHPNACSPPSIVDGILYIPCGYNPSSVSDPSGILYAYTLPSHNSGRWKK
jgi:polyvinyl alcohol dehydrogenase (cytochrome)